MLLIKTNSFNYQDYLKKRKLLFVHITNIIDNRLAAGLH